MRSPLAIKPDESFWIEVGFFVPAGIDEDRHAPGDWLIALLPCVNILQSQLSIRIFLRFLPNIDDANRHDEFMNIVACHRTTAFDIVVRGIHVRPVMRDHVPFLGKDAVFRERCDGLLIKRKREPRHRNDGKFARQRVGQIDYVSEPNGLLRPQAGRGEDGHAQGNHPGRNFLQQHTDFLSGSAINRETDCHIISLSSNVSPTAQRGAVSARLWRSAEMKLAYYRYSEPERQPGRDVINVLPRRRLFQESSGEEV